MVSLQTFEKKDWWEDSQKGEWWRVKAQQLKEGRQWQNSFAVLDVRREQRPRRLNKVEHPYRRITNTNKAT